MLIVSYVLASVAATVYVAPFQVDGTESYSAMFLKVFPLMILAYFMSECQERHQKLANRERIHLIYWVKMAYIFGIGGDFFMVDFNYFSVATKEWCMTTYFSV